MTGQPIQLSTAERDRIVAPLEQAWTLPPRLYTAADVFDVERERIFHRDHRETLQPEFPARRSSVVDNEGGPWALLRMPALEADDRSDADELLAAVVFPTLLIAASSVARVWYRLDVQAHDRMHLRIHYLVEPETLADPVFESEIVPLVTDTLASIHEEDIVVSAWRGLHAPHAEPGRLSPFERAIWQINQLWLARMSD